jgi:hypothetical protein
VLKTLKLLCVVSAVWLLSGATLAAECVIKTVMTDAELRACSVGEPRVARSARPSKSPVEHFDQQAPMPLGDRLRDQQAAVSPTPIASTAAPNTTRRSDGEMHPLIILLLSAGAVWLFCKFLEVAISGATKAAKATVYVGAAATGLTVGILEGAARGVAARYASCPFCLSVIRSRASVCKHCLRALP